MTLAQESPLVTTAWLAAHVDDPKIRIVDIRGHVLPANVPPPHYFNHQKDYETSHIPNAVFVDWVQEITDPSDPRHAQIAPPERYAAVMGRLGIDADTLVVAYDDAAGMFAARLWWSLQYYGHARAVVLDGGWTKWVSEARAITNIIPTVEPTIFVPRADVALRRTAEQVLARLDSDTVLVDVRTAAEFNGQASRAKRAGHIPSAVNLPRNELLNADGTLLDAAGLRAKFAAVGVTDAAQDVVTYCNGGVSASFGLLALRVAGLGGSVYDGSWKEWGNDDSKPIA
jgi:thiosulfate/3-mercaptopyruvate sulfurtransferase